MNEPILTSGFPQVAPEPKPFSLYDKPSEVSANPSRDNAQPFNLTPFTFAVAEKVATAANERMLSYDVMGQALKGKTPMQYFDELGKKAEEAAKVGTQMDNDIADLRAQIASLKPQQADTSGYRAAMGAFDNLAAQAPVAPTLGRLNLTDTDKMMLGFALLTGANPQDAIGNFIKVKQGFVDQNNDQLMGQYKLDATNFNNQIDAAGTRLTNERQLLNDTQQSMDRQYNDTLDSLGQQANQLMMMGRAEESNQIRRHMSAVTEWKNAVKQAEMDGNVTDEEYAQLEGLRVPFLSDRRLDVGLADTLPMPTRGKTLAGRAADFKDTKYTDDKKRFEETGKLRATKLNYDISMGAYKAALTQLKDNGNVEQGDIDTLQTLREELSEKYGFPVSFFPIPKLGMSWQRLMAEASGKRQDAAAQRQLGGDLMGQYWKNRTAALESFDVATEPFKKAFEDIGKEQDALREDLRKAQQKYAESGSSSDEKAFESARQAYQANVNKYQDAKTRYESRVGARLRLIEQLDAEKPSDNIFGGQPFDPTSGNPPPLPGNYVIDKPPAPRGGAKPGGLLDPRGGNPNPKDKGKTPTPTPTPQPKPKPAEKAPNAGKGQPPKPPKSANVGGVQFNKTK